MGFDASESLFESSFHYGSFRMSHAATDNAASSNDFHAAA
jgi:hypothetical protein